MMLISEDSVLRVYTFPNGQCPFDFPIIKAPPWNCFLKLLQFKIISWLFGSLQRSKIFHWGSLSFSLFWRFLQVKGLIQTKKRSQILGGCGWVLGLEAPLTMKESWNRRNKVWRDKFTMHFFWLYYNKTVTNNFVLNLHLICFKTTFEDVGLLMRFSDHWRPWKAYFSIFLEIVIFLIVSLPLIQIPFWVFFLHLMKILESIFFGQLSGETLNNKYSST